MCCGVLLNLLAITALKMPQLMSTIIALVVRGTPVRRSVFLAQASLRSMVRLKVSARAVKTGDIIARSNARAVPGVFET
jgi:hypothetical protein